MTELISSVLLYAQALALLQQMQDSIAGGVLQNVDDVGFQIKDVMTRFEAGAGQPLMKFEKVVKGEPPSSDKMNRTWQNAEFDVNILRDQLDVLRAATIFGHNYITAEIIRAGYENEAVNNKTKTLQLYSGGVDSKTFVFGDSFGNQEFIDIQATSADQQTSVQDGFLTLGRQANLVTLNPASVTVLNSSNGFLGNNQEIEDPSTATILPEAHLPGVAQISTEPTYTFVAQTNRAAGLIALVDGLPNTWIEYEHYLVADVDRAMAGNLGFTYSITDALSGSQVGYIDWSLGPTDGILDLSIQLDFGSVQNINYISYVPYGLKQNVNYPVLVNSVSTSADGTTWTQVQPTPVWIATDANLQAARTANNVAVGTVTWPFEQRSAQFVRLELLQPQPINCNIGHLYYTDVNGKRVEGPIPTVDHPDAYDTPNALSTSTLTQHREYFIGKRWAIGIRDFVCQQVLYQPLSIMVTKPILVNGVVDRVTIDAETFVPSDWDPNVDWIQFFISPDDGVSWFQISRIQDNFLGIPEQIAFNDPLPKEFQEPGVGYFTVPGQVTSVRVKIQLSRPDATATASPLLRDYQLKVRRR